MRAVLTDQTENLKHCFWSGLCTAGILIQFLF
jgi:hypothetical protein